MAYENDMRKTGDRLFRWRSYVPLVLVALVAVELRNYHWPNGSHSLDLVWEAVCLFVGGIGVAIRAHVVGHAPADTSGRNTERGQVAAVLNTTGLYSVVRNPLYLGNAFMWLGAALFLRDWRIATIAMLAFFIVYERIVMAEERFLEAKFEGSYGPWAAVTPAFWPRFSGYVRPNLPFSLRNVLKREYGGAFGFIAVLFAFEIGGDWFYKGEFLFDPIWVGLMGFSTAAYLTLRTLEKHTRYLHVEGR
jgi:protein-S-isoprenylcysteine O-methyltransferase Ste14